MPTKARSEDQIIQLFVSAYENESWKQARLTFPDKTNDGEIDGFAERADGSTLAIEHSVVEPFVGDIADQTEMVPLFPSIEKDTSLLVPDIWIRVFIPVGTFHLQRPHVRETIVKAVHDWLRRNRLSLPKGSSEHLCNIAGIRGNSDLDITLTVSVVDLPGEGKLNVHRQQVGNTLGDVIERLLTRKLPKLVKTAASKRVLLLERQHMNLLPENIHAEVEKRRAIFPKLAHVHEIWIVERIPFFQAHDGDVRFELWEDGELVHDYDFQNAKLLTQSQRRMAATIRSLFKEEAFEA